MKNQGLLLVKGTPFDMYYSTSTYITAQLSAFFKRWKQFPQFWMMLVRVAVTTAGIY